MADEWLEKLKGLLIQQYGQKRGEELYQKYSHAFTAGYIEENSVEIAAEDITNIEELSAENTICIHLYRASDRDLPLHLRLFQWQKPIALSDILPMLENFDLRTYNERPHKITLENTSIWISDFSVEYAHGPLDVEKVKDLFQDAFEHIYKGLSENDGFNKLVLAASLSWSEIIILRTYAKYLRQVRFRFSQAYIEKALVNHSAISKKLVELFMLRHDPKQSKERKEQADTLIENIKRDLEKVASLDEDTILRRILDLINATIRTNYYQRTTDGKLKTYLSLKLQSELIPELPLPVPLYETFVYSPDFEAIHLRKAKVARGGIRWSDRPEDFRTEILGLMKAQVVKNAVIVPTGAKGGFVLKRTKPSMTRENLLAEVIRCYQSFIRGLLDITDNIIEGEKIVHPKDVFCYDDNDPYLVVAADKGTASFSDIANTISKEYQFWLGDAFASGGATGYDHKKMGITARGAWESIKRHFRELNINVLNTNITVVGIGDMSGDVFGNGMMYTKHIRLVAAFDHRDIFIDPNPDPIVSFEERVRLFYLPVSSWHDYNPKLISKGGGVFSRTNKSIQITPEMQAALGIEETSLAPNDLIRAILKAPVDLLYNGGIGTYVKASYESDAEVGDRTNDYCRVNGNELHCRVVGEGGNLGFTQLGRIEYSLAGGLINTDFIDNSAGVDCSDHEVNLKILLDKQVEKNKLTEKKRNEILESCTDEVASLVLKDNYYQALVMSFSAFDAPKNIGLHTSYIKDLESAGIINRQVEFLPDDKRLVERKAQDLGLTRPELAILLAYTKIHIKHELLDTNIPEDKYLRKAITSAFPKSIRRDFPEAMDEHRLHRDIIATQLSNRLVNEMGITFVYRLQMETGATVGEVVRAHAVASHIFETRELQKMILALDFKIPMSEQYEMLFNLRRLINLATRWFLLGTHLRGDTEELIEHYSKRIKELQKLVPQLMTGHTQEYLSTLTERFLKLGLPEETARMIATYRAIYTTLNVIDVATVHNFDLKKTAEVYFAAGERINLVWFRDQIANDVREGHWNALARLTLRDELDISQRALTVVIMNKDKDDSNAKKLIERWAIDNARALRRWESLLSMLHGSPVIDYSMFFIALRELIGLIVTSQ